jgi:methionyl-tRNA formyltransferase
MDIQTDLNQVATPERVVLFGSEGGFSRPVLKRLLAEGVSITAVVMPGFAAQANAHQEFPVAVEQPINKSGLAGLAASHEVPVYRVLNINDHRIVRRICDLTADILLVACFPFKLPKTLWQLERIACWNLHPSLLPKYRGPAPVYWQLCNRESNTGVTLHEVSERLDAGSIVAQKSLPMSISTSASALEERLAECGVDLFLEALAHHRRGSLTAIPQDEVTASYFSHPAKRVA